MKKVTICIQNKHWDLSSSFDVSNEFEENYYYTKYNHVLIYITTQILRPVTIKHPLFDLNEIMFFLDSKIDYDELKEYLEKITQG